MKIFVIFIIIYLIFNLAVYIRLNNLGLKNNLLSRTIFFPWRVAVIHYKIAKRSNWSPIKKVRFVIRPITDLPSVIVAYSFRYLHADILLDALNQIFEGKTEQEKEEMLKKLVQKGIFKKVEPVSENKDFDPDNIDMDVAAIYRNPNIALENI